MYYVGVDIGGTFTDCVLVDEQGHHRTAKALSTRANPAEGVLAGLALLADAEGLTTETLLRRTARLGHGTTIGTNAVLERRGARVGLVATAGHGDALALMRGSGRSAGRSIEEVFSVHASRLPEPITVRGAVTEVQERVDASGAVVVALDVDRAVRQVLELVSEHQLDSVAIALLWSFANPAHEQQLAAAIGRAAPEVFVSISSQISPRLGEYERTVATVMNGYVGPACARYLGDLEAALQRRSLTEPLLVMQSHGGVLPAEAAATASLGTIDSGPAGGLTGVATLARRHGHEHVIATDMGGTSFDIGLVVGGRPVLAEENVIDQYTYRLPHLDVRTVACGGGTLARYDDATGALRVGPQSAGSEPGPVAYGRGGAVPTVTDADVVLGFLRPDAFLGGRMPLDRDAARAAMAGLAEQLGLGVDETAAGILEINNMRAATVIRQQTIERGLDPRDFVLYAYGGAGPVHAFGYAGEAGIDDVVIPLGNGASTLSAYGIASGDVIVYQETERSLMSPFVGTTADALVDTLGQVQDAARAALDKLGFGGRADIEGRVDLEIDALMRYQEQLLHSLDVAVSLPAGPDTGSQLLTDFHEEYARRYGEGATDLFQQVEIFAFRVRVSVSAAIPVPDVPGAADVEVGETDVYWPDGGWTTTAVYAGVPAAPVVGPALVELAHTTIAVPPGAELAHSATGALHLRLSGSKESR